MSLGLVSEFPREDTSGLSVWAHPTASSHLQEGGGGERSLTDLGGANKVPSMHTPVVPPYRAGGTGREKEGCFPGHLLCTGP